MKSFLGFLVLLAVIGGGGYWWWEKQQEHKVSAPRKPIVGKLDRGDVTEKVSATGKVAPREKILVSTDVPLGIITEINPQAEPGKFIKAGTWLLRLKDTIEQARLKEAESALKAANAARDAAAAKKTVAEVGVALAKDKHEAAKKELNKAIVVGGDNITKAIRDAAEAVVTATAEGIHLAESDLAAAEAAIKAADANVYRAQSGVDLAQKGVEMMTILAKQDGVILDRRVFAGQPVSPQQSPLFIMMPSANDWEIYALVSEGDIARVQKGQSAEFTADAYSGKNVKFKAAVLKKDFVPTQLPTQSPIGIGIGGGPTNYGVTLSVTPDPRMDKDMPLLAGMTANVDVLVNSVKNALRIPKAATQYQPANLSKEEHDKIDSLSKDGWQPIWVWSGGQRAELVFIKTGVDDGSYVEVKEQLQASGQQALQPGLEVIIEEPPPEEKSGGLFGGGKAIPLPR